MSTRLKVNAWFGGTPADAEAGDQRLTVQQVLRIGNGVDGTSDPPRSAPY